MLLSPPALTPVSSAGPAHVTISPDVLFKKRLLGAPPQGSVHSQVREDKAHTGRWLICVLQAGVSANTQWESVQGVARARLTQVFGVRKLLALCGPRLRVCHLFLICSRLQLPLEEKRAFHPSWSSSFFIPTHPPPLTSAHSVTDMEQHIVEERV